MSTISGTIDFGLTLFGSENPVTVAAGAYLNNNGGGTVALTAPMPVGPAWFISNYGRIAGADDGLLVAAAGTVTNQGTISGASYYGIWLQAGGAITNKGTGLLKGGKDGVDTQGAATVSNAGQIVGSTSNGIAAYLGAVYVTNSGTIKGAASVFSYGVRLNLGGAVTNQSGGVIGGFYGVYGSGAATTIVNAGGISGSGPYAVKLGKGFANRVTIDPGGTFTGTVSGGNSIFATAVSTLELAPGAGGTGTLSGLGTQFVDFTQTIIDSGAAWVLTGADTIGFYTTLTDIGALTVASGSTLTNGDATLLVTNGGSLTNAGEIERALYTGDITGVTLISGSVTNQHGGTITADRGIYGSSGTVVNAGSIGGDTSGFHEQGVGFYSAGSVINQSGGTITGYFAVVLHMNGTVVNAGDIAGVTGAARGDGVHLEGGRFTKQGAGVTNQSGGTISGNIGVYAYNTADYPGAALTVVNAGSIIGAGGFAVALAAGVANLVVIDPGAVFVGTVSGGNTIGAAKVSTLELASGTGSGVLSGLGSEYVDFAQITVDAGASWVLAGTNTLFAGATISNAGSLTVLDGFLSGSGNIINNGVIIDDDPEMRLGSLTGTGEVVIGYGIRLTLPGAVSTGQTYTVGPGGEMDIDGTITNAALLFGGSYGVQFTSGGSVTNQSTGRIQGQNFGVTIGGGPGTVSNDGSISGGTAAVVLASGFTNRVIADPGAVFTGTVDGGNAVKAGFVSTLELAPGAITGMLSGLGTQFIDFAQTTIDAGASWTVTGANALAAGSTLTNLGVLTVLDGSLNDAGTVLNDGLIQDDPSTMTVGTLTGTGLVLIGGGSTLTASASVAAGQTVAFAGTGLLALTPSLFLGQIDGLGGGGRIELTGITDATFAGIVNGNTLAIHQSAGPTLDLTLDPSQSYAGVVFPVVTVGGVQSIDASEQVGPTVIDQGETESVTGAIGSTLAAITDGEGGIVVTGANSLLQTTASALVVGDIGTGSLSIDSAGAASALAGLVIANTGSASGSTVDVTAGDLTVTGTLIGGNAGAGLIDIAPGGLVSAGVLDLGLEAGGSGVLTMEGSLTTTTSLVVGGAGAGELSLLNGASVTIGGDLDIGSASGSSGNVDVENTTGTLIIDGNLNVGVGGGVATMTIGLDTGVQLDNGGINQGKYSKVIAHTAFDPQYDNTNGGGFELATGTNTFLAYFNNNDAGQVTQDASGDQSVLQVPTIYGSPSGGSFQINSGDASLTLNADGVSGQTFQFTDNTGTLVIGIDQLATIDVPASGTGPFTAEKNPNLGLHLIGGFGGTIASMVAGDAIVVDTTAAAHIFYPGSGTVVSVIDNAAGTQVGTLAFASAALAAEISVGSTSASQLELVACFAAGTRIGTADGWVKVEDLRVGDRVRTMSERPGFNVGAASSTWAAAPCEPIVWIGSRTVNCARHPRPETVWPVRVSAGAFGENVPERELYLSPDHAVFVNGVLVPVKLLINNSSITQVKRTAVTYYHVELPEHAIILAEGLTVESYLHTGDRANFDGEETILLYPNFAARLTPDTALAWEAQGAAPLVMAGEALERVRALLPKFHAGAVRGARPNV